MFLGSGPILVIFEIFTVAPIKQFMLTAREAILIANFRPSGENAEFFKKSSIVTSKSALSGILKNKNIILIFAEGTSLSTLSETLTPNTWGLMTSKSLNFTNYFSHTVN